MRDAAGGDARADCSPLAEVTSTFVLLWCRQREELVLYTSLTVRIVLTGVEQGRGAGVTRTFFLRAHFLVGVSTPRSKIPFRSSLSQSEVPPPPHVERLRPQMAIRRHSYLRNRQHPLTHLQTFVCIPFHVWSLVRHLE